MYKVEWKGSRLILLNEYLEDKVKLQELQRLPKRYRLDKTDEEIIELEKKIKTFISMLSISELQNLILMSLDIELG